MHVTALALLAVALAAPTAGYSQNTDCEPPEYLQRLLKRYSDAACREADPALAARVKEVRNEFYGASARAKPWIVLGKDQLGVQLSRLAAPMAASKQHIDALRTSLKSAIRDADKLESLENLSSVPTLSVDAWEPTEFGETYLADNKCIDAIAGASSECDAVYAQAVALSDTVYVTQWILGTLSTKEQDSFRQQVSVRADRWHAYLYDTQFQYWWELAVNRYLEEQCPGGVNGVVAPLLGKKCTPIAKDEVGNAVGWREPPELRAVVLHPDVGVQYNRDELKGDRLKPSFVFQWIGYQWWDWRGDKVSGLKGIALVSTVSDNANSRTVGHGIQVQLGRYALAVTSHGGKPALTFSVDLLSRLNEVDRELSEKLKEF